jgi:hypothetical protein
MKAYSWQGSETYTHSKPLHYIGVSTQVIALADLTLGRTTGLF